MAKISIRNLKKQFGASVAVSDFSLDIEDGEMVAFLGPSGCGKTTTLRMVAGFIEPTAGTIEIGGQDVTRVPPHKRNAGMVFQRYALFPHMTIAENVAFGLEMHKVPKAERTVRVKQALDMVRLDAYADRYPRQLSGGQQQRVAIARALAIQPKVFLLDEPLSNLDAKLRVEVREEIRALQQRLGLTTIFVTHDQEEALTIADRLAIMHDGRIQQVGTASDLYERPQNRFVADFLGKMNFFDGALTADGNFATTAGTELPVGAVTGNASAVGVRPERVTLEPLTGNLHARTGIPVTISSLVYMGALIEIRTRTVHGETIVAQIQNGADTNQAWMTPGELGLARFAPRDCVFFNG
ncbi:ABC transporter ATP-binding protein [Herbaspirillum autotrophicum]|uniref:ABC transporter ATP-binding protein n=1 Tax=Herbaspirillum autotrophicum TaxID=180195 RepID=UPI00067DFDE1|nr:ABC transporter ATP-binding protein [Herbaspirillum autotrophicum]